MSFRRSIEGSLAITVSALVLGITGAHAEQRMETASPDICWVDQGSTQVISLVPNMGVKSLDRTKTLVTREILNGEVLKPAFHTIVSPDGTYRASFTGNPTDLESIELFIETAPEVLGKPVQIATFGVGHLGPTDADTFLGLAWGKNNFLYVFLENSEYKALPQQVVVYDTKGNWTHTVPLDQNAQVVDCSVVSPVRE